MTESEEIDILRKQLAPFRQYYDNYVEAASRENISLGKAISITEEMNKESFDRNLVDPDLGQRKFWLECDMAAYFELLFVIIIHKALTE